MTRPLLALFATVWLAAGVAGVVLGLVGAEWVTSRLPPLSISADAVGGALTAIGLGLVILAGLHAALVIGLGAGRRWAATIGVLLTATSCIALLAIAASAATSAARSSDEAELLLLGAAVSLAAAAGYGWCAVVLVRLVARIGSSGRGS